LTGRFWSYTLIEKTNRPGDVPCGTAKEGIAMNPKTARIGDNVRMIIIALLIAAAMLLMLGAGGSSQIGRYQVNLGGGTNPVIVDTATGQWKLFDVNTGAVIQTGQWSTPQSSQSY
jgi:hypothetical protein